MQRSELVGMLVILAEQTKETVSPERLAFIASELAAVDPERLRSGLRKLIREAKRFPTIAEIEAASGVGGENHAALAAEASARIEGAIVRYGSARVGGAYERQRAFMGELAWAVCERLGGYQHLCDTLTNDDMSTAKAQWRNLALALCESAKRGTLHQAPSLPGVDAGLASSAIAALSAASDIRATNSERLEQMRRLQEIQRERDAARLGERDDDGGM